MYDRLEDESFEMEISEGAIEMLLREGTSDEFGARELKRTVHRHVIQPVSARVARGELPAGCMVKILLCREDDGLAIVTAEELEAQQAQLEAA